MTPIRLQLSRASGFNLQAHSRSVNGLPAVKCDRTTRFGNPWRIGEPIDMRRALGWGWNISPQGRTFVCLTAEEAVEKFENALIWDEAIHSYVREQLGGRNLACWCDLGETVACHCKPLLFVANSTKDTIRRIHEAEDEAIIRHSRELLERVNGGSA